jgi:hypothetical protein
VRLLVLAPVAAALAFALAGCGGTSEAQPAKAAEAPPAKACAHRAGWQKLANRIGAPVYCPTWLPDPLIAQIGGQWNNIDSVSRDRSYLESFIWQDTDGPNLSGELHVNLRGYPGRTRIPTCQDTLIGSGGKARYVNLPCFADPHGQRTLGGLRVTEYTVNQGADQWHLLYLWRYRGGLYTVSEHVAPPLTFGKVQRYLDRITRSLVLVAPQQG